MNERYSREIISFFPYPVAAAFVRLRTDECLDPGARRLKWIWATAEAISRLFGIITLCECRELLEEHPGLAPPRSLTGQFKKRMERPTWASWLEILRDGQRWLTSEGRVTAMPELAAFALQGNRESEHLEKLACMLDVRNDYSHDRIKALHQQDFINLCKKHDPILKEILSAIRFLTQYELVFISTIEVHKARRQSADFRHRLKKISGISSDFQGDRKNRDNYLDTQSIFLANLELNHHLNLDPFFLYEESAGRAPDVFFFNGISKGKNLNNIQFSPCKHGGNFLAGDCHRCKQITSDIASLLNLFSPTQQNRSARA